MGPGASGNVLWDYQFVREKGLHEKLVILTPPDLRPPPTTFNNVRSRAVAVWERDTGRSLPGQDRLLSDRRGAHPPATG